MTGSQVPLTTPEIEEYDRKQWLRGSLMVLVVLVLAIAMNSALNRGFPSPQDGPVSVSWVDHGAEKCLILQVGYQPSDCKNAIHEALKEVPSLSENPYRWPHSLQLAVNLPRRK